MNIVIKSKFEFNEQIMDSAYGLAKTIIIKDKPAGVRPVGEFVLTASKTKSAVYVKVQKRMKK